MLLISIPTPCHEDWNKMSPREQGAFCGVCAKTVVDFTDLSDEQVKNYFLENQGKKTCGRFRNEQLVTDADYLPKLLKGDIPLWKKFLAAVVILFAGLLTGCGGPTKGKVVAEKSEQSTTGVILTEIKTIEPLQPDPVETVVCTGVTQGEAAPVIFEDVMIVGAVVDLAPLREPDTAKLMPVGIDTLGKPIKKECDGPAKDSVTYFDPD